MDISVEIIIYIEISKEERRHPPKQLIITLPLKHYGHYFWSWTQN